MSKASNPSIPPILHPLLGFRVQGAGPQSSDYKATVSVEGENGVEHHAVAESGEAEPADTEATLEVSSKLVGDGV